MIFATRTRLDGWRAREAIGGDHNARHWLRDHGDMRLNHVALTVSDRERSATFYRDHFGLTERVHDDEHLLILGSQEGTLLALSAGKPGSEVPRTNHFGFQLSVGEEVRAARERFRTAGVRETEWQDDGNFVRVQVADPDGYRVEMFAF
ncbi:MAG: VOC family protein [Solirubrobacterales bacterium]|nr:VOC family protein [Solirubrobacterales bacterium]